MTEAVDELNEFFSTSEAWKENLTHLFRNDVIHHEIHLETRLDPIALEYLFLDYLTRLGRQIRNIGHAVVGDRVWIKFYTIERPIVNIVLRNDPNIVIGPQEPSLETWTDQDVDDYLARVPTRQISSSDRHNIQRYFQTYSWREI